MVALKTLQSVGYSKDFFKLPKSNNEFYVFDTYKPPQQPSYWNLVGINQKGEKEAYNELQFLYIDEEALQSKVFSVWEGAGSFLSLRFEELQALIFFLEAKFDVKNMPVEEKFSYFTLMSEADLAALHFDRRGIQRSIGRYYRYHPASYLQAPEKMSVVGLPSWHRGEKIYSLATLVVATFDCQRLNDPAFRLMDVEWLGSIKLNVEALSEFVLLLKQQEKRAVSFGSKG